MIARGEAAEAIPCAAAALHTDLIVMHSRRQSYPATLLGSTAEMISRAAPCPVLITHSYKQDWVSAETGEIRLKNILMAYDFSNDAELALGLALFFAEQYQAALHLLHVIPTSSEAAQSSSDERELLTLELQQSIPEEAQLGCEVNAVVREALEVQAAKLFAEAATARERSEVQKLAARVDLLYTQGQKIRITMGFFLTCTKSCIATL